MSDFNLILNTIIKYMKDNNLKDLSEISPRNLNGDFAKLSIIIRGVYDFNYSLKLSVMWKRNSKMLKTLVFSSFQETIETINKMDFEEADIDKSLEFVYFPYKEFKCHLDRISNKTDTRKRFLVDFHYTLNKLLQKTHNINCLFVNIYNWLKSEKCIKSSKYWNARYNCKSLNCNMKLHAFIDQKPMNNEDIKINVNFVGVCKHEKILLTGRCKSNERKKLALELMAKGVDTVLNENIIQDYGKEEKV